MSNDCPVKLERDGRIVVKDGPDEVIDFGKVNVPHDVEDELSRRFNALFYAKAMRTWGNTHYCGLELWQTPTDLWVYQELIFWKKPDLIIETGTGKGGCTLYIADILNKINKNGTVLSIEEDEDKVERFFEYIKKGGWGNITILNGNSLGRDILKDVSRRVKQHEQTMVFLDSTHEEKLVLKELETYSKFVQPGGYIICQDTNVPGPAKAVVEFVKKHPNFQPDLACEKYYLTFHPCGYLRRMT
jgi:cephalosporin hydroxylase